MQQYQQLARQVCSGPRRSPAGLSRHAALALSRPLLISLCRSTQLWLSLGGFQECGPTPDRMWALARAHGVHGVAALQPLIQSSSLACCRFPRLSPHRQLQHARAAGRAGAASGRLPEGETAQPPRQAAPHSPCEGPAQRPARPGCPVATAHDPTRACRPGALRPLWAAPASSPARPLTAAGAPVRRGRAQRPAADGVAYHGAGGRGAGRGAAGAAAARTGGARWARGAAQSPLLCPLPQAVVAPTPAGCLGLTTCYDLRFPELFAHLVWDRGATVRSRAGGEGS
jgi:hypothetical protein